MSIKILKTVYGGKIMIGGVLQYSTDLSFAPESAELIPIRGILLMESKPRVNLQ